jgi:hypothetical protein
VRKKIAIIKKNNFFHFLLTFENSLLEAFSFLSFKNKFFVIRIKSCTRKVEKIEKNFFSKNRWMTLDG